MNLNELAIIVPLKADETEWVEILSDFEKFDMFSEIIFVIQNDIKDLLRVIKQKNLQTRVKIIYSNPGRAEQLNEGAKNTNKPYLWFLHADSRISENVVNKIKSFKPEIFSFYFFNLKFNSGSFLMNINNIGVWLRSNILSLPFGDQSFLLSQSLFNNLGNFPETLPYGEDHVFVWRAKLLNVKLQCLHSFINTSARKYEQYGWGKTTLTHLYLTLKQALPFFKQYLKVKLRLSQSGAIAIFVKTIGFSPVKTRLAQSIGKFWAEVFYSESVNVTQSKIRLIQNTQLEAYWAVAEKEALSENYWAQFKNISQGDGGLGDRLNLVYKSLLKKHGFTILIGADSPHINVGYILKTIRILILNPNSFVIGKCMDGGFYLFAGNKPVPKDIWCSINYSSETTASELEIKLKSLGSVFEIENSFDVDTFDDLKKLEQYYTNLEVNLIEKKIKELTSEIILQNNQKEFFV